jgi:hypothetical protein
MGTISINGPVKVTPRFWTFCGKQIN